MLFERLPFTLRPGCSRVGAGMRFTSFRPFAGITLNIVIIVLVTVGAGALAVAADLPAVTKAPPPDSGRLWVEFDYLAWTVKGDKLPPLVTTSPPGTP